ncbi:MAG: type II toxin-antitoxin system MqsA family antitoxin [bacterium]|nr:type II toxin-antitoxin system MqsA family antitoxin [bacterium]
MKCVFCGGALKHETVTFHYEDDETYLLVEHVPADVCSHCGERLYAPEVTDALLNVRHERMKPTKVIQVPVYDFTDATRGNTERIAV